MASRVDEVQKIPRWPETVKRLWDEDTRAKRRLKVVLLGSAPLPLGQGLTESLAGRFEILRLPHWTFGEMRDAFGWPLDRYVYRLFELGGRYSGQVLSYTKMLGQLPDAGNTVTLAHYLHLLAGAGMLVGIQKFAGEAVRQRASSPKPQVLNTALMTALSGLSFDEARRDREFWGRLAESAVGAHLAKEVKSGRATESQPGMGAFAAAFRPQRRLLVGGDGIPLEDFLSRPVEHWIRA